MPLCPDITFSLLSFQETLNKLLLKKPLRPHHHPLATYHYTGKPGQGGDSGYLWTPALVTLSCA